MMHTERVTYHSPSAQRCQCGASQCRCLRLGVLSFNFPPVPLCATSISAYAQCTNGHRVKPSGLNVWQWLRVASQFVGSALLLAALALWLTLQAQQADREKAWIESPRINDFWFVDHHQFFPDTLPGYQYTTYKVIDVDDTHVTVQLGNLFYKTAVSPRQHVQYDAVMQRQFFRLKTTRVALDDMASLHASGAIYAARRPTNMTIAGWIVLPRENEYARDPD